MNIRFISLLLLGALGAWSASAQSTINFTAGIGERDVYYDVGAPLPNGNLVSIGFFDADFDVFAYGDDLTVLLNSWNELGGSLIKSIFGEPGRFAGTLYNTDPRFDDQKIWMWIFKTTGDTAPSVDYDNVLGYGLYSSSQANWIFPVVDSIPMFNTASINSSDVDQAAFGTYDANHLILLTVPEPPAWMLGAFGLGAAALFFSRKQPVHPQKNSAEADNTRHPCS